MKKINLDQMPLYVGGGFGEFCAGFGAVAAVYEVGVLTNLWNPVGWGAAALGIAIGGACAAHALS